MDTNEVQDYQYKHFKATVPERRVTVGVSEQLSWRYYDNGPRDASPVLCFGGVAATAEAFYKQLLALAARGYRVVAADPPACTTHAEWVRALDLFLDALKIYKVHLYGTSLGGFLCQLYALHRPRRVLSLVLSNSFFDTRMFNAAFGPWVAILAWAPDFVLKRLVLSGLRDGPHEPFIADSIDFVVAHLELLSRADLAARLQLNTQLQVLPALQQLPEDRVTIMDSNDFAAVPVQLRDALAGRYPGARRALLKSGGDFPFLSRADEVNLHLQLHLRRAGAHRGAEFEEAEKREMEKGEGEGEGEDDRWSHRASAHHSAVRVSGVGGSNDIGQAVRGESSEAGPSQGAWQSRGVRGGAVAVPLGGDTVEGQQGDPRQLDGNVGSEGSALEGNMYGDPLSVMRRGEKHKDRGKESNAQVSTSPVWRAAANSSGMLGPDLAGDDGRDKQREGVPWAHGMHTAGKAWSSERDDAGEREDDAGDSSGDVGSPERDYMPMPGFTASPPLHGVGGGDASAAGPHLPHAQSSAREWLAMVEGEHYDETSPSNGAVAGQSNPFAGSEQHDELIRVAQHLRLEESPLGH